MTEGTGPDQPATEETKLPAADQSPMPSAAPPPPPPAAPPPPPAYQPPPPGAPGDAYVPPSYPQQPPPSYAQQPPPSYPQQPPPSYAGYYQAPRRGMGTGTKLFLLLVVVLLVGALGFAAAIASGVVKITDLQRLIGQGPGTIIVQNVSESASVVVDLTRLDDSGNEVRAFDDQLGAGDVRIYPDRPPGAWDVAFTMSDGTSIGTCRMTVAGNGEYTFVVLDSVVFIEQTGVEPASGDEFLVDSSPLCDQH